MIAKVSVRTVDRRLSIIAALDDPALFAPHFRGDTWMAWRAFLAALFALPMDDADLDIYKAHTGRKTAPATPFTEAALIVGRRGGKSRALALSATFLASFRDYEAYLAPGEVATVAIIAANRSQARSIFRFVSGLLKAVPLLASMVIEESNEAIRLSNRVVIEIGTASFRTTRGYSFAAILADEIAFWRSDETSANPDVEILRALRPGMASIPGSILLLASSPYAKRGALYAAYRRYYGHDDARVLVWKAATEAMNPRIDPATIAEAYEDDPESARAEYGAEFRDDLADFVTREIVDAVMAWDRHELPPQPGVTYSAFCDPSGGASDSMTLAVGHLRDGSVCVLDAVIEIRAPFDPEVAVADCAEMLRRYGIMRVVGDRYGGEWPKVRFCEHGIEFEQSARAKSELYLDLLPLLNARRVELLDVPRLGAQLVGLERRTARSGRDSVDHTPGGKDDLANAVAGVLVGLDLDRRPSLVKPSSLTVKGAPVPIPANSDYVFATVAVGTDGMVAAVFVARGKVTGHAVTLVDFDVAPLGSATLRGIAERLTTLATECRSRNGEMALVPAGMLAQAIATGLRAYEMPVEFVDAAALALGAAMHIAEGKVKVTSLVAEKAQSSPWGGALDFRSGDRADAPLRVAIIQAIAMALDEAA